MFLLNTRCLVSLYVEKRINYGIIFLGKARRMKGMKRMKRMKKCEKERV